MVAKFYKKQGYDIHPRINGGQMAAAGTRTLVGGTVMVYAGLTGALGSSTILSTSASRVTGWWACKIGQQRAGR